MRKRDGSAREGETRTGALENVSGGSGSLMEGKSIGGLAGKLEDSTICGFSQNAAAVKGTSAVGGIAGWAVHATITDSSNTGCTSAQTNLERGQKVGVITAISGNVGGLAGLAEQTYIGAKDARTATYNDGKIVGDGCMYVGGLVGRLDGGKLVQAYNTGVPVTSGSLAGDGRYGSVTGKNDVGGLVGAVSHGGEITAVFHSGDVTGSTDVGGLAGSVGAHGDTEKGTISQAYSGKGKIAGRTDVGGLVGLLDNGKITEAYSLSRVVGVQGFDEKTTGFLVGEQMKKGIIGTKKEDAVYYVRSGTGSNAPTNPVGTIHSWNPPFVEEHTPEELMHAEMIGWKNVSVTLTDGQTYAWFLKEGEALPQLRALLPPVRSEQVAKEAWKDVPMEVIPADEVSQETGAGHEPQTSGSSNGRTPAAVIPNKEIPAGPVPKEEDPKTAPNENPTNVDAPYHEVPKTESWDERNAWTDDRTYEFTIRGGHPAWFASADRDIEQGTIVSFPRYDAHEHFFTLEGTVLHPIEQPLFGGAQLKVAGAWPLISGTTIATASPALVLEAAEDSEKKAGNSASRSE